MTMCAFKDMRKECEVNMEEGISLLDLLKAIFKNWLIIVLFIIVGIALGSLYSVFFLEEKYESKSSLLVAISHDGEPKEYDYNNSLMIINTVKELSKQTIILEEVALDNDLKIEELASMVEVTNPSSSLLLVVSCKASTKQLAESIVDDMADVLIYQCSNNPNLAMIGNSLVKTSTAKSATYVGKNKLFTAGAIALVICAIGVVVVLIKEFVIKAKR